MSRFRQVVFFVLLASCLHPRVHPPVALLFGGLVGLVLGNPFPRQSATVSKSLLKLSVIGLGFGLTVQQVAGVGRDAAVYTALGIALTFAAGALLARLIPQPRPVAVLITAGTAICGGSAIAAVAPAIRAKDHETSVALATVFTLNAVALLLFPLVGHAMGLSQPEFGVWAAMAIHDTSSVVGACDTYGHQALAIGTVIKLTRALWIIPVAFGAAAVFRDRSGAEGHAKVQIPWFLAGFVAAALLRSFVPPLHVTPDKSLFDLLYEVARQSLVVTIFLIGSGLTRATLAKVGHRPLLLAVVLWVLASCASLGAIRAGLIPIPKPPPEAVLAAPASYELTQ